MKKVIIFAICVMLVFAISNAGKVNPKDDESDEAYMLEQLSPYLNILDKLNQEYEGEFIIPENGLEEVYNNIIKIPLEEFEDIYRGYYEELKDAPSQVTIDANENQNINTSVSDNNYIGVIDIKAKE